MLVRGFVLWCGLLGGLGFAVEVGWFKCCVGGRLLVVGLGTW